MAIRVNRTATANAGGELGALASLAASQRADVMTTAVQNAALFALSVAYIFGSLTAVAQGVFPEGWPLGLLPIPLWILTANSILNIGVMEGRRNAANAIEVKILADAGYDKDQRMAWTAVHNANNPTSAPYWTAGLVWACFGAYGLVVIGYTVLMLEESRWFASPWNYLSTVVYVAFALAMCMSWRASSRSAFAAQETLMRAPIEEKRPSD